MYTGTVDLTSGQVFTSTVTATNVNTAGGQVSGTVVFAQYPDVGGAGVIERTTPNISATLSGTFDSQGAASGEVDP